MDIKLVKEVTDWLKTTDLAEFCYEKDGNSIEVKTQEALPEPAQFACSLTPVLAPAIGIYHTAAKGQNIVLTEGQTVEKGAPLGVVETFATKHILRAPAAGKLRAVSVKENQPVEFGLPLFFIEPQEN